MCDDVGKRIALRFDIFHENVASVSWRALLDDCTENLDDYPALEVLDPRTREITTDAPPQTGLCQFRFRQSRRVLEAEVFLMGSKEYTSSAGGILSSLPREHLGKRHRDTLERWTSEPFQWLGIRIAGSWKLETPLLFGLAWSYARRTDGLIHLDYDQLDEQVPPGLHDAAAFWRPALSVWTERTAGALPWRIFEWG